MASSTEPDDAPEWLVQKSRRARLIAFAVCLAIGSLATLAVIELAGRAMPGPMASLNAEGPARRLDAPHPSDVKRVDTARGTVHRAVPSATEILPAIEANSPQNIHQPATPASKQTVFTDQNWTPRGAANVVRFSEAPRGQALEPAPPQPTKVTVVSETPSMKDRACWPNTAGSLERRNCRSAVGRLQPVATGCYRPKAPLKCAYELRGYLLPSAEGYLRL